MSLTLPDKLRSFVSRLAVFLLHPIFIFVLLQIVSVSLTVIWVIWYVKQSSIRLLHAYDLAFLIAGCILMAMILLGTVILFTYGIKEKMRNRQQKIFVSSVTHELRSPIASMQLSLDTLSAHNLDTSTVNRLFSMIRADLNRLMNLVDQILVSARLDRGIKIFDEVESFALSGVLNNAVENISHHDQNLIQRVHIKCPNDLKLYTAKSAISLVITNLLENAVKYSPPESEIRIEVIPSGGDVTMKFIDRGFGLNKREEKKIFKIFNRGEIATKNAISGTGLGLYIVKSVVNVLGGRVWAESAGHGLGSTFTVKIPTVDGVELRQGANIS